MDLKIRSIYAVPQAYLHTGKMWCEFVYKFRSYTSKCDFVWLVHMKWRPFWLLWQESPSLNTSLWRKIRYVLWLSQCMLLLTVRRLRSIPNNYTNVWSKNQADSCIFLHKLVFRDGLSCHRSQNGIPYGLSSVNVNWPFSHYPKGETAEFLTTLVNGFLSSR